MGEMPFSPTNLEKLVPEVFSLFSTRDYQAKRTPLRNTGGVLSFLCNLSKAYCKSSGMIFNMQSQCVICISLAQEMYRGG